MGPPPRRRAWWLRRWDSFDLTDGQIFRAHASAGSAIHLLYAGRAVVPVRACLDRQPTCLDAGFDM
jgi:hypothetical protein